jgi:hypothetical protein
VGYGIVALAEAAQDVEQTAMGIIAQGVEVEHRGPRVARPEGVAGGLAQARQADAGVSVDAA